MQAELMKMEVAREIICSANCSTELAGMTRLHGGSTDAYRIDFADVAPSLVLKIYPDERIGS